MDAAQALFLAKGYAATSVDEIVRDAQVAKGTFYLYFKTKDDILRALEQRFVEGFQERLHAAVDRRKADDWIGRLDAWLEASLSGYFDNVQTHDLVFRENQPLNLRMPSDHPIFTHLATLIADGEAAGAWTAGDAHLTAVMLFHAMHGAVDDAVVAPKKTNRKRLLAGVLAFAHRALAIDGA